MKKSNVVNLAIWKRDNRIPYKPTFYKQNSKINFGNEIQKLAHEPKEIWLQRLYQVFGNTKLEEIKQNLLKCI